MVDRQPAGSLPLADPAGGISAELSRQPTQLKMDPQRHQLETGPEGLGQPGKPEEMEWAA
jgi:hypothetical protein